MRCPPLASTLVYVSRRTLALLLCRVSPLASPVIFFFFTPHMPRSVFMNARSCFCDCSGEYCFRSAPASVSPREATSATLLCATAAVAATSLKHGGLFGIFRRPRGGGAHKESAEEARPNPATFACEEFARRQGSTAKTDGRSDEPGVAHLQHSAQHGQPTRDEHDVSERVRNHRKSDERPSGAVRLQPRGGGGPRKGPADGRRVSRTPKAVRRAAIMCTEEARSLKRADRAVLTVQSPPCSSSPGSSQQYIPLPLPAKSLQH